MKNPTVILTENDKMILESYKNIADGLGDFLGSACEIVIHNLESLDSSIIKIVNGNHSGRTIGAPITDVALSVLTKLEENKEKNFITYFAKNKRGEQIKSSISAIYGERNRIIGLFCVNFFLNTSLFEFVNSFINNHMEESENNISENFVDNAEDLMIGALEEVKKIVYNDLSISSSNKNKEIVYLLYQRGIFNLKDSVITISNHLGISKNTVYMHLRNINKQ
ncbi:PAS domain-containing protein [Lachnospiraceae bacterium 46-61]